jgi:hypothetical protein
LEIVINPLTAQADAFIIVQGNVVECGSMVPGNPEESSKRRLLQAAAVRVLANGIDVWRPLFQLEFPSVEVSVAFKVIYFKYSPGNYAICMGEQVQLL